MWHLGIFRALFPNHLAAKLIVSDIKYRKKDFATPLLEGITMYGGEIEQ